MGSLLYESLLLYEALSDKVYHYTTIDNLLKICKENAIILQSAFSKAENYGTKQMFYLSTTRNKSAVEGFAYQNSQNPSCVRIELDGRKLNQKYKGAPIDYWGGSMGKQSYYDNDSSVRKDWDSRQRHKDFEAEDRLFSYEPIIENISDYIVRVDILVREEALQNNSQMNTLVTLAIKYGGTFNINFYDNEKDYNNQSENTINDTFQGTENWENHFGIENHKYDHQDSLPADELIKLAVFIVSDEIGSGGYVKEVAKLLKQYGLQRFVNKDLTYNVNKALHNSTPMLGQLVGDYTHGWSKNPTREKSQALKMLADYMRQHDFRSIQDAVLYKQHTEYSYPDTDGLWGNDKTLKFCVFRRWKDENGTIIENPKEAKFSDYFMNGYSDLEDFCQYASREIWEARGGYEQDESEERIYKFLYSQLRKNDNIIFGYDLIKQMCRGNEEALYNILGESSISIEDLTYSQARSKCDYRNKKLENKIAYMFRKNG